MHCSPYTKSHNRPVIEVSRPDFMGLDLDLVSISVSDSEAETPSLQQTHQDCLLHDILLHSCSGHIVYTWSHHRQVNGLTHTEWPWYLYWMHILTIINSTDMFLQLSKSLYLTASIRGRLKMSIRRYYTDTYKDWPVQPDSNFQNYHQAVFEQ